MLTLYYSSSINEFNAPKLVVEIDRLFSWLLTVARLTLTGSRVSSGFKQGVSLLTLKQPRQNHGGWIAPHQSAEIQITAESHGF